MATSLLRHAVLLGVMLCYASAELSSGRVQQFHFKSATHYRKEYKDQDGTVYGEYGLHMPDGWTRVLKYETTDGNVQRLMQEYRTPTEELLGDEKRASPPKGVRETSPSEEELENETEPEIQIFAVPQLWKVRGQDLLPSASELQPVSLENADQEPTLAPPTLTQQRALYNFGYVAPYHGHNETGTESGAKFGQYYVDLPNCWRSVVRYYADEEGYHPTLRRMRTPGCLQQKREVSLASVPTTTAREGAAPGPLPQEGQQGRRTDQPTGLQLPAEQADRAVPATPQQLERQNRPRTAKSEQRERVDKTGPAAASQRSSADGDSSPTPAACAAGRDRSQTPSRPYGFAYNAGTHYHWERGFANGTKVGAYAVQLPDGTLRTTSYTADCSGFRPSVTVEPIDQAKFRRDFEAFNPPKEAKLFGAGELPQASALVRSAPAPAPQGVLRSAQVGGAPPGLVQSREEMKPTTASPTPTPLPPATTEITEPPTTPETTPPSTTASTAAALQPATPSASTSRSSPAGGRRVGRRLAPIVPLRPAGSGPYHFYVHLKHNYHEERSYKNGTVAGQYGVVAPDGVLREVGYTSSHGYVPTLTDTQVGAEHDLSTRPRML